MNNIRQITNFSEEIEQGTTEQIAVTIGDNIKTIIALYAVLPASILTKSANTPINQLGYVCEPRGIDYPIVLTTNAVARTFYLGKTGMFETMPELFIDINNDSEEIDCIPRITEVKVPIGEINQQGTVDNPIKFKLDYMFATN